MTEPAAAEGRREVSLLQAGVTVRDRVLAMLADVSGKSTTAVDGPPLKELVVSCDTDLRSRIAAKINAAWSNLSHTYGSADITCSDTVDTLTRRISGDLV